VIKLLEHYPSPSKLVKTETKVLEYLMNHPYIKRDHPEFARHASASYYRSRNGRGFEFASHLDIWHTEMGGRRRSTDPRANLRLLLASVVALKGKHYRHISHCLTVLRLRSRKQFTILRKFHFDVTVGDQPPAGRLQRHPRFHMQYCGELIPYMKELGIRETQLDQLHPWLSEPRVFHAPMSLALMLDMSLGEFPDAESVKFRSAPEWKGIIREHETLVLRPFLERCLELIKQSGPIETVTDGFYIK
jgi:hypothetical protein